MKNNVYFYHSAPNSHQPFNATGVFINSLGQRTSIHPPLPYVLINSKNGQKMWSSPRVCIMGTEKDDKFVFTVSRCSPKDSYCKEIGRNRCTVKFKNNEFYEEIPMTEVPVKNRGRWFINMCEKLSVLILNNPKFNG